MAEQRYIMIGGRLHSVASDHVVVGADEVWDDELGVRQSELNKRCSYVVDGKLILSN